MKYITCAGIVLISTLLTVGIYFVAGLLLQLGFRLFGVELSGVQVIGLLLILSVIAALFKK